MSSQTLTRAAHTRRGGAVYSIASMNSTCHMVCYICLQLYTFYNAQLHPLRARDACGPAARFRKTHGVTGCATRANEPPSSV